MTSAKVTYHGGPIFDGRRLLPDHCLVMQDGKVERLVSRNEAPSDGAVVDLAGDLLCPGFVDLQVNGGGGVMFNDDPSVASLRTIAKAHASLGTAAILPTLITDEPARTRAAIEAAAAAITQGIGGIAGLHLEGPHIARARKGAHDVNLIRPMADEDLHLLLAAARTLPALMITLAPEAATVEQVAALAAAGAVISLGHSDADFQTCMAYADAGARCVTHLFNAMSQLGSRAPGLVGAALANGGLSAGLIADGIHVHPASMRAAIAAKTGPGRIFLVSDAMAPAGTDIGEFLLGGRKVRRSKGRLTLEDGTLAGADLALGRAIQVMVKDVGMDMVEALRAATSTPAALMGLPGHIGSLTPGQPAHPVRLTIDMTARDPLARPV